MQRYLGFNFTKMQANCYANLSTNSTQNLIIRSHLHNRINGKKKEQIKFTAQTINFISKFNLHEKYKIKGKREITGG